MEHTRISLFYRSLIVLAGVLLLQFVMLGYQLRAQSDIPLVRFGTILIVEPVHRAMRGTSDFFRNIWFGYIDLRGTRQENQALNANIDQLKLEKQQLLTAAAEAVRLRGLLDLKAMLPVESIAARVLGGSAGETSRLLLIDKGADAGIQPDMPVMVPDGIVGKVLAVFPDSAQVILLTDPYSGAGVLLEQTRMHGILKGRNDELTLLDFIPNGERIALGQRVFTSGEDKIYPPGLAVGVVEQTKPGTKFQEILVRPLAKLQSLEEVLVILRQDFSVPLPEAQQLGPQAPATVPTPSAVSTISRPASPTQPVASRPPAIAPPAGAAGTGAPGPANRPAGATQAPTPPTPPPATPAAPPAAEPSTAPTPSPAQPAVAAPQAPAAPPQSP